MNQREGRVPEWHTQLTQELKHQLETDPTYLALILVGSVARGEATEHSDLDFVAVVTNEEYARRQAARQLFFTAQDVIDPHGNALGGYVIDYAYLLEALDHGDERTRFQFVQAQIVFSRIADLDQVLTRLAVYPEHERIEKMKSFYSQLPLHFSFMELAEYSQNAYLLSETAVALVLFGGRLILAHNRMLYPNRKWFMRELEKAPDKPDEMLALANRLLQKPGIQNAEAFVESIMGFAEWPQPEEGQWQRIHQDSIWNWRSGAISLAER